MQQSQIPHRRNSLSQSQASSAQQRMSGSTIEKPMYRGSGGETLPAGYGPSRQEKAQGPAPVHHNPPDVHHLHSHPHSEIESKWEMPSKEIPSGARQGVGSLPGERGEIGVALLPGEGGLGMQPSMKGVDAKGGMKGVGMGAGISKAGGGGRSGMSMGHGIRGGMKASMSGMRAARMEASIRHSIGSKAHLHPHLHAQSHTHPQARGHLEQGEQERKQPAAKLKGPPPTNLMPQITYHRTLSTSGAELPLHEVPTMSHAGCGSLPGPNTEAGVAVLPDERKFLKGLIKEIGARKAMKGQEVVFDSGVGIKKGGVGKAPKSVNAPTYPPTAPLLPLETYGNTLPIDGSEMPLHEVPSRPHKFGCGSLPGSMGEVGVAVVPDERMGIIQPPQTHSSYAQALAAQVQPHYAHGHGGWRHPGGGGAGKHWAPHRKGARRGRREGSPPTTPLMNIESYNRTLSMDGSEMPLHEVPSGSHHAGVGSLPGGNEEMGVAVPPDLRMRMRKGNKHMKKHGPGGMGHVAREKWINGAPATHPLLQQETYNRTLSTDGSELPLHEVPSGPHRFGCGSLPGGNEETGVAVLPMERMAGGVAGPTAAREEPIQSAATYVTTTTTTTTTTNPSFTASTSTHPSSIMKKNINTNIDTNANPFLRRNKTQQEGEEGVLPAYRDTQVQNTCGAHGERRERPVEVPPDATSQVLATQFPSERPGLRDEPTTIFNADEKEKLRARDVVMGHVQLGSFPKREKPIVHEEKVAQPVVVKKQVTVHERDFARPVQRAVPLDSSSRHKAEAERDMQETQRDRAEVARVDGGKARERTLQADSRAAYKRLEEVAGMTFGLSEQRSDRPQREREWREDRAQSEPQPERQDSEWWGNAGRKLGEVGMDVGGRTIHATGAVAAGTASLVGGTATQVAAGTANLVGGTASQVAGAAGGVWSGMWQGAQEKLKEAKDYVFAGDKTEPLAFDDQDIVSNERRMRQLSPGSSQDTGEAGDSSISRQGQKQVGFESSQSSDRTGDRPGKYEDVDVGKRLPECGQDVTRSEHFPRQQSTKSSAQVGRRAGDATVSFRERQKQPGLKNFGGLQPPLQWSLGADRHAGEVGDAKESRECQAPVGKAFEGGGNIGPPESSISSDQEAIQSDRSQRQQSLESSLHGVWSPANQGAISPSKHENQFIEDHHPPSSWSQGVGSRSGEFGGRKQLWNEDAEAGKNRGLAERSTSGGQNVTQVERWQSEQSSESPTQDIGHRPGEAMGFSRERQKQPGSKTTEGCQPPSRGIEGRAGNAESRQQSSESSHDVVSRSRDADISSISRERRKQVGFGDVEGYQQSRSSEVGVYSLPRERQKQMGIEDTEDQSQRRRLPTRIHEQEQAAMHTQPSAQGPIRSSTTPRSSALRTEYYRSPLDMQEQSGSGEGTLPGYLCGNQMSEVIGERMYEDHMRASMANDPIHTTTNTIRSVPHLSAYDPTPKTSRAMSNISTRAQRGSPPPTSDVTPGLDSGIASFHRTGARIEEEPMDEQWSASASRGDTPFAARVGDAPRVVSQQGYSGVTATSGSSKPVGDASRAGSQRLYGGTTATSSASKPPTIHVGDLGRPISKEEQKAQQLRQQQQSWESAARNIN